MTGIIKVDDIKDAGGNSIISSNGSGTLTYTFNAGSIARAALAADIIDGTKLADNAVDSEHYADGSIDLAHMSVNSIDSDQYVDGSIDLAHMSVNSIDSDQYVDGSIDLAHMSVNSIDSDQYVDGSIDTAHIGATQVTGAKLNTDVISAQTALTAEPADTDEFMVSDGGVLKRIDYSLIKGVGKVGQLVVTQTNNPSTVSTTSGSWTDTGIAVAITPTATSSKIYLRWSTGVSVSSAGETIYQFYRDSTALGAGTYGMWNIGSTLFRPAEASWLDSPSSTSAISYKVYFQSRNGSDTAYATWSTSYYQLSAMEILL